MSFSCPKCGATSYNPHDEQHRYCGNCHEFFSEGEMRRESQMQIEPALTAKQVIQQFVAERNQLLRSLDVDAFHAFWKKWRLATPPAGWSDPIAVPLIMMHQTRLSVSDMTAEEKAFSKQWLKQHGYGFGGYYIE